MTEYKIEKNIPVPVKSTRGTRYPFDQMSQGDSFLIPVDPQDVKATESARRSVYSAARRRGIKVMTRKMDDGVRVWRKE